MDTLNSMLFRLRWCTRCCLCWAPMTRMTCRAPCWPCPPHRTAVSPCDSLDVCHCSYRYKAMHHHSLIRSLGLSWKTWWYIARGRSDCLYKTRCITTNCQSELRVLYASIVRFLAEWQVLQRLDRELVARRSNCLAVLHKTSRGPASRYKQNATPLYSTITGRQAANDAWK